MRESQGVQRWVGSATLAVAALLALVMVVLSRPDQAGSASPTRSRPAADHKAPGRSPRVHRQLVERMVAAAGRQAARELKSGPRRGPARTARPKSLKRGRAAPFPKSLAGPQRKLMRAAAQHQRSFLRSPRARRARRVSRRAYRGASRRQAVAVASSKFKEFVKNPAYAPLALGPRDKLLGYQGAASALVSRETASGHEHTSLVDSSAPLQTRDDNGKLAPVDLHVARRRGGFAPANPMVNVELPEKPESGVDLPDNDIGVHVGGNADAPAQEVDTVLYPNLGADADDTDLMLRPEPAGVQVAWQLRRRFGVEAARARRRGRSARREDDRGL